MADTALKDYDPAYVEHVIKPFLRESFFQSETPISPSSAGRSARNSRFPTIFGASFTTIGRQTTRRTGFRSSFRGSTSADPITAANAFIFLR